MARSDVHSIKNLDPTAYEYVGTIYDGPIPFGCNGPDFRRAVEDPRARELSRWSWADGNYRNKGTCDHCGACFHYGAVFVHTNGDAIVVGHQCAAGDFQYPTRAAYELKITKERAGTQRMAAKGRKLIADAGLAEDIETDHYIVRDIKARALRKGKLSDKQIELVRKLAAEAREHMARREAEKALAKPVKEGKGLTVTGTIISAKYQDGPYGSVPKILVRTDYGAKLWGTLPASIDSAIRDEHMALVRAGNAPDCGVFRMLRGRAVQFMASVFVSQDDPCFGFFSRPRQASLI